MAATDVPDARPRTALVLSGGGARGAYEAGVVSQLYTQGETFDVICGTSIGAINGALIAQRPAAETLRKVWSTIQSVGVITETPLVQSAQRLATELEAVRTDGGFKRIGDLFHALEDARGLFPLSQLLTMDGGLDPAPVIAFLKSNLDFAQLQLPYIFAATNVTHGSSQVFYKFPADWEGTAKFVHEEPDAIAVTAEAYAEAVRSSGAIPLAFPPVLIPGLPPEQAGSHHVDGGVANNTPIGQAVDAGADKITVIFMDPATDGPDNYPSGNLVQVAAACYAVMSQTILQADFDLALRTNKAARAGAVAGKRVIELREIRPAAALPLTILDFDKQDLIDQAFALGVADAKNPPAYQT
jgi:NTE family protein